MRYIEAPAVYSGDGDDTPILFMAGGITGCPDWQDEMRRAIDDAGIDVVILNPRRKRFDVGVVDAAKAQITWEHKALRQANWILFWFCRQTIQPIVLFELGCWLSYPEGTDARAKIGVPSYHGKRLFIGMDPAYPRRIDVEVQTSLARPEQKIVYRMDHLVAQVKQARKDWPVEPVFPVR